MATQQITPTPQQGGLVPSKRRSRKKSKKISGSVRTPKGFGVMILHMIAKHKEVGKSVSDLKRDIPYFLPDFRKETQVVEARLYYLSNISTVAATAFTTVTSFTAAGFNNFSDFASIFDEYRIVTGMVAYCPSTYVNTAGWNGDSGFCIACIDYGVSAANGSQLAAYSHDNKKIFNLTNAQGMNKLEPSKGVTSWTIQPEPLPDQDWIPTTTNNTVFYYWKPYMEAANSPGTGIVGKLFGFHDFQFRGMAA